MHPSNKYCKVLTSNTEFPPPMPPTRILFVCLGNICRSPAAEIIFRKIISDAGREADFEVDSAGTIGFHQGAPPDSRMAAALTRDGFTVTGAARQIHPADLQTYDLIVTMDETNFSEVQALDPSAASHTKIRPFVSFCRHHDDLRVPDPYYGGQRGFDHVMNLLRDGCQGILEEFPGT